MAKKILRLPSWNVSPSEAVTIVKCMLDNPNISFQSKVLAIEQVSEMSTLNSVTKDELKRALQWLFEHYDFLE
jgi:hypothetical protein